MKIFRSIMFHILAIIVASFTFGETEAACSGQDCEVDGPEGDLRFYSHYKKICNCKNGAMKECISGSCKTCKQVLHRCNLTRHDHCCSTREYKHPAYETNPPYKYALATHCDGSNTPGCNSFVEATVQCVLTDEYNIDDKLSKDKANDPKTYCIRHTVEEERCTDYGLKSCGPNLKCTGITVKGKSRKVCKRTN